MGVIGKVFLASMPILMSMFAARYREEDRIKFLNEMEDNLGLPVEESFDFIIVGGGTAGCVVARRLVDAQFSVLLLETGGTPAPPQAVPAVYTTKEFNYNYRSVPQSNANLGNNGIVRLPAAKMLGGGSSHNGMYYERGHPIGYEKWAQMTGDSSWAYPELLKYFLKAENFIGSGGFTSSNVGQHAVGGPMSVVQPKFSEKEVQLFLQAGKELGYASDIDPNGPQRQGFSRMQFNRDSKGRRESTYTAYVKPIEKDPQSKLTLRRYSAVQKIIFENKTAVGVVYNRHGVARIARATKEVIVSAGAFVSPIILILSGIGPEDQLRLAQVDPVSILPVGYNLMDHPNINLRFSVQDESFYWGYEENMTSADISNFLKGDKSPLNDGQADAHVASVRAQMADGQPEWPDILYFLGITSCNFNMARPYSKGRLTLNISATSMEDDFLPIVDPNYYGDESDFNVTLYGIETCFKIFEQTEAFKKVGGQYAEEPLKRCERFEFKSRDYWKCYIQQKAYSSYHMCCSNKMGKESDGNSVVDSKFRVFGVENLRVVDASAMPTIPNVNTAAPVVALAEKAADIIVQHHNSHAKHSKH